MIFILLLHSLVTFAQEATFRGGEQKLVLDKSGVGVTLITEKSKVPNFALISTVGESNFHILYAPGKGYFIANPKTDGLKIDFTLFSSLVGDMHESGISCDLRSGTSVLNYSDFKVLEFRIDPKFDGKPTRYLRLFVSKTGKVVPLDLSSIPMSMLVPDREFE